MPGVVHLTSIPGGRHSEQGTKTRLAGPAGEPPGASSGQEFPQYPPPYYAGFWLDLFGIMIEAVCHHDR